jgi:hypothetical protein
MALSAFCERADWAMAGRIDFVKFASARVIFEFLPALGMMNWPSLAAGTEKSQGGFFHGCKDTSFASSRQPQLSTGGRCVSNG